MSLDLVDARLRNQRLTGTPLATPADVVSWLGAVQAQEYGDSKWALALRSRRTSDDEIERAFALELAVDVSRRDVHAPRPNDSYDERYRSGRRRLHVDDAHELVCLAVYIIPRTSPFGAILLTGYLGGAVATHVRVGDPLFTHILFPTYIGLLIWAGLYLRDDRLRTFVAEPTAQAA